jgi:hypothetical protein
VFIDARAVGSTPLSLARVSAGAHTLRVERAGYRPWSSLIQVLTRQRTRIRASLEK